MATATPAMNAPLPSFTSPRKVASQAPLQRLVRDVGALRLVATAVFALLSVLFARYAWQIPLGQDAERALYDVRSLLTAPHVAQDGRIIMIVYTDETLAATGKRSPPCALMNGPSSASRA